MHRKVGPQTRREEYTVTMTSGVVANLPSLSKGIPTTYLDPFFVGQCGPNVVGLGDGGLVGLQHHLGPLRIDVECSQNEDQTRKGCVGGDGLQPVIIQIEQHHLRLRGLQHQISQLLNFQDRLEG